MAKKHNIKKSLRYFKKAQELIPSCTQTFSKGYTQFSFGASPIFIKEGRGSHVWDVDGNEYIDYLSALGPVILGYGHPAVTKPVIEQIKKGTSFSLPHEKELELAGLLCEVIPCCEMARFGKNGSDATAGAVRAARAYTGRDIIACCGYHGWQDWYIGTTTRSAGVPKAVCDLTKTFTYNDIGSLERIFRENPGKVACVIMEPMGVVFPEKRFLEDVAAITRREGALLVFDECWTGFRMSLGGAQEYFKVVPDMACFGKGLGNGFPISAIVGKRDVMKIFDEIFYSFTFGGDVIGITAAIAVINFMRDNDVIKYLNRTGTELWNGIQDVITKNGLEDFIKLKGYPARNIMEFRDRRGGEWWELKSFLQQEIHKRGVLFGGFHAVSYSHTNRDIARTIETYDEAFRLAKKNIAGDRLGQELEGDVVGPVFRKP